MCRSIKTLRNSEAPTTDEEIRAAALQFVRKVSGYRQPSKRNVEAFERAVADVSEATNEDFRLPGNVFLVLWKRLCISRPQVDLANIGQ